MPKYLYLVPESGFIVKDGKYEGCKFPILCDEVISARASEITNEVTEMIGTKGWMERATLACIGAMDSFREKNPIGKKDKESTTVRFIIDELPLDSDHMGEDLLKFVNLLSKFYRSQGYRVFVWLNWTHQVIYLTVAEPDAKYIVTGNVEQAYGWFGDDIVIGNIHSMEGAFPEITFIYPGKNKGV